MKIMTTRFLGALLVLGGLSSAGCYSRLHLSQHHGRSNREAFQRQAVNPGAGATAKSPKGLDALEATIVVETYRAQLAPQGASTTASNQMILVSPNSGSLGAPGAPAASAK